MFAGLAGFLNKAASAHRAISSSASNAVGSAVSKFGGSVGEEIGEKIKSMPKTSKGAKKSKYIAPEVQPVAEAGVPYIEAEEHLADLMNKTVQQ
jgi:hypothetical protein